MKLSDSDKELLDAFDTILRSSNPEVQTMLRQLVLLAQLSGEARDAASPGPFEQIVRSYQRLEEQNARLQKEVYEIKHVIKSALDRGSRYYDSDYDLGYSKPNPYKSSGVSITSGAIDDTIKQLKKIVNEDKKKGFW